MLAAQPAERRPHGSEDEKFRSLGVRREAGPRCPVASCIASSNPRPRTTAFTSATAGGYRIRAGASSSFSKKRIVLPSSRLDAVVLRIERLHHRLAASLAAAGPTGHLRQQLKGAFAGAEISEAQAHVR